MPNAQRLALLALLSMIGSGGCAAQQVDDPSFTIDYGDAQRVLATMRDASGRPRLERPVVVLDGVGSWGSDAATLRRAIAARVDGDVISVCYPFAWSFDACRRATVAAIDRELGAAGADETIDVDVVGLSMGGLVALYGALDDPALGKRVRIHRLFTISAPLTGAREADRLAWLSPIRLHRAMRQGSALYASLTRVPPSFPVVSYSRLQDPIVGARYASLPGQGVFWLANRPGEHAHFAVMDDPRIVADVLRRLRGESPLTAAVPSPLPEGID